MLINCSSRKLPKQSQIPKRRTLLLSLPEVSGVENRIVHVVKVPFNFNSV